MKSLNNFSFKGKCALIRVDFNVPLNSTNDVTDSTRVSAALPTINHILKEGGSVVLISHLGRPKNGFENQFSLKHIVPTLNQHLNKEVTFVDDCIGEKTHSITKNIKPGEVILLENLRFYKEEKAGDDVFAKKLAQHGDIYVNDAFGTAHRAHASTAVIASHFANKCCFGLLMQKELENVRKVMANSKKPFTAIIGGAKVSSKISIIINLLDKIDNLIIGGGMSYTFIKAQGGEVGSSLVEDEFIDEALHILKIAEEKGVRILIPDDSIVADEFSNNATIKTVKSNSIKSGWMGLDIGPIATEHYTTCIQESKTILWNGPMGVFEMAKFEKGTKRVANSVVIATESGAYSLIGGGDSVAAINKYNLKNHVSYVSTGGGALLELIEGKELPGIAAIENH